MSYHELVTSCARTHSPPLSQVSGQEMVGVQVRFCPRDNRTYEALIPVYVDDPENPDNDPEEPYLHIEVQVRHGAVCVAPVLGSSSVLTPPRRGYLFCSIDLPAFLL